MRSCNMLLAMACAIAVTAAPASAQAPRKASEPFAIIDNSFLVEEAFNQDPRVVQNILNIQRLSGAEWNISYTQEWPMGGVRNQISYTLAVTDAIVAGRRRLDRSTFALNYRYQLREEAAHAPAISPRLSLLLPKTDGGTQAGLQLNIPASKQFGDFYVHLNAGYTWNDVGSSDPLNRQRTAAASVIFRVLPMFHLMLESTFATHQYATESSLYVSPGFRAGINFGKKQFVYGLGLPMGLLDHDDKHTLFGYLSYELPF